MSLILMRGGGDLATGVTLRLHRAGYRVIITELPSPLAVRRTVSFSEAVYEGQITVEGVLARQVETSREALELCSQGLIPVIVDPQAEILSGGGFSAQVDARLTKRRSDASLTSAPLVIGLGPGFICGENCHAVVETHRGHTLGRVYWQGTASEDTGQPDGDPRRVLRAPRDGMVSAHAQIGDLLSAGQPVASVAGQIISAPFGGVLRGLIRPGLQVSAGVKIGDIDPRGDPAVCLLVSDKALAVGGGVLEALLSAPHRLRP